MDEKKHLIMENVLNKINQQYIQLSSAETKKYKKIMNDITTTIVDELKKDVTFSAMYERTFFGGSFYDNLKVGKAEEYDLDIVLNLPIVIMPKVELSDKDGFVFARVHDFSKLYSRDERDKYLKIHDLMNESGYISTVKVFSWIQGLFAKVFNELPKENSQTVFQVQLSDAETVSIYGTLIIKAPAFTLNLNGAHNQEKINLDIDLVPCFQFTEKSDWPGGKYRKNTSTARTKFLIVPKKPHKVSKDIEKYWRLSFQEQERDLINNYKTLKPTIKLLKKLRDQQNHVKIASYFIKTIFLWEVENCKDPDFWTKQLSVVFMTMLKKYTEIIQSGNIPYFWNNKFNLIENLNPATCKDLGNCLKRIIKDIEDNPTDPFVIGKYLLSTSELQQLISDVDLGKKNLKKIQNNVPDIKKEVKVEKLLKSESSSVLCKLSLPQPSVPKNQTGDIQLQQIFSILQQMQSNQKEILSSVKSIETRLTNLESKLDKPSKEQKIIEDIDELIAFDKLNLTANYELF